MQKQEEILGTTSHEGPSCLPSLYTLKWKIDATNQLMEGASIWIADRVGGGKKLVLATNFPPNPMWTSCVHISGLSKRERVERHLASKFLCWLEAVYVVREQWILYDVRISIVLNSLECFEWLSFRIRLNWTQHHSSNWSTANDRV